MILFLFHVLKTYLPPVLQLFPLPPSASHPFPLMFEFSSYIFSWVQLVLPSYSWEWDLPWCGINLLRVTSLKKMDSPSPNSYQMPNNPQLVMGFCAYLIISMLGFCLAGTCASLNYACHNCCEFISVSALPGNHCLLELIAHLRLWDCFCSFAHKDTWAFGEGVGYECLL